MTVDDVIWSCPDCDGDLEHDSYGLWCPRCEQVVPYACLPLDADDAERAYIFAELRNDD